MKSVLEAITYLSILSAAMAPASAQPTSGTTPQFLGQTEGDFVINDRG